MRFQAAHKLVTYLLALATLAALSGTRALAPASAVLFLAACALSWAIDPGSPLADAFDRRATPVRVFALALFALLGWRIWRRLPDSDFGPAVDLGLSLLAAKLFFRRTHRDYIHILAFSAVMVLVASTLAASFLFVAAFFAYAVLAVWALILFHLRREMEENYLVKHSAQAPSQKVGVGRILGSRRVVGRAFFVATGGVALAVLAGAVAVFMAVPRFGAGFVLGGPLGAGGDLTADEEVTLGRYGTRAAAAHAIVLRVAIPELAALPDESARRRAAEDLYFRGAVYDLYDRGRWTRSRVPELRTLVIEEDAPAGQHRFLVRELADPRAPAAPLVRQEIEVLGHVASVLPALDRPQAFELPAERLGAAGTLRVSPRWSGEAALRLGAGEGFVPLAHAHYTAFSSFSSGTLGGSPRPPAMSSATRSPAPLDATSSRASTPLATLPDTTRAAYLTLPTGFHARFEPAKVDATPELDAAATIAAVVERLRAEHGYSTDPPAVPAGFDPIESFLAGRANGHCELFASAAVLLLRSAGIPARYTTGFRGGDWNALGDYVAVRDDRAHAWAEAFVPGAGWTRVDATPPGPPPARRGRVSDSLDAVDHFWTRWVVGFDSPRQRDLAQRAGRRLGPLGSATAWKRSSLVVAVLAGAAALAVVLARAWRRRSRASGLWAFSRGPRNAGTPRVRPSATEVLYQRTLRRLGRAGWPRRMNETPREYATRVRAVGLYPDGDFDQLTERYGAARFGARGAREKPPADLAAKLASITRSNGHPGTTGASPHR